MDEEDFRAIIAALAAELRGVGADDLTDEAYYTETVLLRCMSPNL